MPKRNGLRALQMRIPRRNHFRILFRLFHNGNNQFFNQSDNLFRFIAKIQPDIHRHLVVTTPRRM